MLLINFVTAQSQEPYFRLRDLDNQWKEYADLKGSKLTVVDFWATWCQPCVKSLPLMNDMAVKFADDGVRFIGVSIDGTRNQSKIKPFIRSIGITYPIIRDVNSELMSDLSVTAVPTLLIYDSEGNQIYFHEGFRPGDELTIEQHIREHLEN